MCELIRLVGCRWSWELQCGVTVMMAWQIKLTWFNRFYSSAHIFNNWFLSFSLTLSAALLDCFWGYHRDPPDPVPGVVPATWQPDPESPHQHHLLGLRSLHTTPGHLRGQVRVKYTLSLYLYNIILYIGYLVMLLDENNYFQVTSWQKSIWFSRAWSSAWSWKDIGSNLQWANGCPCFFTSTNHGGEFRTGLGRRGQFAII